MTNLAVRPTICFSNAPAWTRSGSSGWSASRSPAWMTANCSSNISQSESVALDDGRIKSAAFDTTQGFGLRAVAGEAAGYAHASELSEAAIKRAGATVRAVASGHHGTLAEAPHRHQPHALYRPQPAGTVDLAAKTKLLAEIDAYARGLDPRVRQVMASIAGSLAGGADHPRRRHAASPISARWCGSTSRSWSARATAWRPAPTAAGGRFAYERYFDPDQWQPPGRRGAAPGAGQSRLGAGPGGRDGRRARPRLAGRHAARGGRPRARGRFQPQEDLGLFRPGRPAGRVEGRHRRRRRHDARPPRLADRRRRRHPLAPTTC